MIDERKNLYSTYALVKKIILKKIEGGGFFVCFEIYTPVWKT